MRPKLKGDVFYMLDEDGVLFQSLNSTFKIHGKGVYPLISKVIPVLDGNIELDSLLQVIPPHLSGKLKEIIQVLEKEGFIRDTTFEQVHTLTQKEQELYAPTIKYIEYYLESANARFEKFRRGKYCIVSSGKPLISMIHAACEAGVEEVLYFDTKEELTDMERLKEIVSFHQKRDSAIQIKEVDNVEESQLDLILFFTQTTSYPQIKEWFLRSKKLNIPFLPIILLENAYFVGPMVQHNQQGCFECAWRRWKGESQEVNVSINKEVVTTATAVLSHFAWLETIKYITGIKRGKKEIRYHFIEPTTLQSKLQTLIPHPLCENCKELTREPKEKYQVEFFEKNKKIKNNDNFEESIVKLFDDKSGILLNVDQNRLIQTPLFQSRVYTNPLREGSLSLKPYEIIASGFTNLDARIEAVLNAVEQYAKELSLSTNDCIIYDVRTEKEVVLNNYHWNAVGCGRNYEEAILRGIFRIVESNYSANDTSEKYELTYKDIKRMSPRMYKFLSIFGQEFKVYQCTHFTSLPITEVILKTGEVFSSTGINERSSLDAALKKSVEYIQNSREVKDNRFDISILSLNLDTIEEKEGISRESIDLNLESLLNRINEKGYCIYISPIIEEVLFSNLAMFGPYMIYIVDKNRKGVVSDERTVYSSPR
ncbi:MULTISPECIES: TOMM precursor leader peptide-binding protein [unclassified Bacillus (in: firmicutes)]|uniref:TOMM precursor leader peptide-binding protein n=1 Tax=unclassified Bacillus (in: firmicutes) TaxID=185979 RepID=UPI000BFA56B9|nr:MULTISPECIES: TOMM precursor leader peptide-binding protein [unclassified Bacillus (in: firmicutes)]PEU19226.1 hypothetical protein CN525_08105 [Bacillus sp. AFS014408]PFW61621.1 hypothetical protein COL20_16740 [Bacillus sp. AFS075034]